MEYEQRDRGGRAVENPANTVRTHLVQTRCTDLPVSSSLCLLDIHRSHVHAPESPGSRLCHSPAVLELPAAGLGHGVRYNSNGDVGSRGNTVRTHLVQTRSPDLPLVHVSSACSYGRVPESSLRASVAYRVRYCAIKQEERKRSERERNTVVVVGGEEARHRQYGSVNRG